jgi:hypothetical protein
MTSKGLAVGASAAIVISGLVSAPAAYANETLSLAPSSGTLYASLTTSSFEIEAGFAGTESSAAAGTLKFRVQNSAAASLNVQVINGSTTTEDAFAYGTTSSTVLSSNNTSNTDFVAASGSAAAIGAKQTLTLEPQAHTANVTVSVQAWLDLNADGDIDTNEARSPIRTVVFYDQANVSLGALDVKPLTLGSDAMTVVITTNPALNYQQLDADEIKIQGLKNVSTTSGTAASAAWNTTFSDYRAAVTLGENVAAGTTYGAQLTINNGSAHVDTGAAAYQTVGSGDVSAITTVDNFEGTSITNDYLRAGSGTFQVYTTVTVGATKSKVVPVTFTISETGNNTLDAAAVVTAGGKELKNTAVGSTQEVEVVVNSTERTETTGRAVLTISYTGLKNGNTIIVKAKATGPTAVVADSTGDTVTGQDDIATALVDDVTNQLRVVKGSNMSVNYTLVDQFGQTPTGSFRLVMSEDGTTPNYSTNVAVSAGKATFSVTENSTANSNYSLTATLQKLGTDGVTWSAANSVTEVTAISAVSAATAGSVTVAADDSGSSTALALSLFDNVSGDSEITRHLTYDSFTGSTLTITVKDSTGALLVGQPVTVSASGLQFVFSKSDAGKVYGNGSITVTTNTSGVATVLVASNQSGKKTITVTAGSASTTQAVTYAAAAADTGADWVLTAPAFVSAGSTFKVTAKLVDDYGNPVKVVNSDTPNVSTTYSGAGIVFGTLPTETSTAGELSFSVLLGTNDSGTSTATVTYDLDGDGVVEYLDFSKSITVTVGKAPASTTGKVNVGSFNGKLVVYAQNLDGKRISWKVGGNWGKATAVGNTLNRFDRPTPRRGVTVSVQIYVDGVLQLTKSVVTR